MSDVVKVLDRMVENHVVKKTDKMTRDKRTGERTMERIKDLEHLEDAIHWMHRAMVEDDRAETLRWIDSIQLWSSEIVEHKGKAVAA